MEKTKFFMLGIITAFGALFLELLFFSFFNLEIGSSYLFANSLSLALVFSVFLEESAKIAIFYQVFKKTIREKLSPENIFLSAVITGLGFSATEIFLTLSNSQINRYLTLLDFLGLLAVHLGTFAILGYVLARWSNLNFKKFSLFFPILFAFHLFYNSFVVYGWSIGFYLVFVILSLAMVLVFFWDLNRLAKKGDLPKSRFDL